MRGGQIDVDPAAKTDDPDPLAGRNAITLAGRSDNPPRNCARDKNRSDVKRVLGLDRKAMAFVLRRRLRRCGIAMLSWPVKRGFDAPSHGRPDNMRIKQRKEDGDASPRLAAKAEP